MKRLVIDGEIWFDVEDNDIITLNGNPVTAASIDSDNLDMTASNLPENKISKEKSFAGVVPTSGRLTNVATFGA